jgi:hypothetical protein
MDNLKEWQYRSALMLAKERLEEIDRFSSKDGTRWFSGSTILEIEKALDNKQIA